jgi:hypothetical protein
MTDRLIIESSPGKLILRKDGLTGRFDTHPETADVIAFAFNEAHENGILALDVRPNRTLMFVVDGVRFKLLAYSSNQIPEGYPPDKEAILRSMLPLPPPPEEGHPLVVGSRHHPSFFPWRSGRIVEGSNVRDPLLAVARAKQGRYLADRLEPLSRYARAEVA